MKAQVKSTPKSVRPSASSAAKPAARPVAKPAARAASASSSRPAAPSKPQRAPAKAARKPLKTAALVHRGKVSTASVAPKAVKGLTVAELSRELAATRAHIAAIGRLRAYLELTTDGTIVSANDNFLRVIGRSMNDLRGQKHSVIESDDAGSRNEMRTAWDRLARGEAVAGQFRYRSGEGRDLWLQANYNPVVLEDGTVTKVAVYATDITEQRQKASDADGQLAAISKAQAVIEFTLDGRILTANANFLNTVGYTLDEVRGQHHSLFVDAAYRSTPEYRALWDKLGRGEFDAGRYLRHGKGGRPIWLEATYNPILDADGKAFKVVKYATDITARVHAEESMSHAVAETEAVVTAAKRGDLSQRIPLDGKQGPIAEMVGGINLMLDGIVAAQEVERKVADENLRIKMALDSVTTNVMIADNDRNIVYMNGSVREMLTVAESDIRKSLPNFDVRKLDGAKIDVFHKHPEHQARMLSTFRDTHRTQIVVGGRTFSLIAAPIINAAGERLGAVVEWKDRTAEVAVENEVGSIVAAAANGDFTQRIDMKGKEGFFKMLGESLNQLLETSSVGLNEVVRVLSALARGDLTETITNEYHGTFGQLKDDSNATVAQLTEIITQIKQATDTINVAAGEIAAGNLDLSQRTEEQAASLEETASSMEELTSTVKQNAENARQANQLALGASDVAIKGGQVVGQVVTTMTAINDSSKKIVDIISVIDGIAFQTNILALNAAVEAARAGEQGRGFAVVAAEVRSLAQRSASAAKEIKTLIGDSVEKVGNGTKLVEQAGKTMDEIVTSVKRVTDIMAEISAASQEQSSGIDQINKAITQMDQVTQQNAALVEEASAAARSMEDQAGNLSTAVAQFTLDSGHAAPAGRPQSRPAPAARGASPAPVRGRPGAAPPAATAAHGALRRPASSGGTPSKSARQAASDTWTEF